MSKLADDLERLCFAETEGKFFDCMTDNITEIIAALRKVDAETRRTVPDDTNLVSGVSSDPLSNPIPDPVGTPVRAEFRERLIRLIDQFADETLKRGYSSSWYYGELADAVCVLAAPMQGVGVSDANMIGLSASEHACYEWPEGTAEHKALRAAYVKGAMDYAMVTAKAEADIIERCAKVADEWYRPGYPIVLHIASAIRSLATPPSID